MRLSCTSLLALLVATSAGCGSDDTATTTGVGGAGGAAPSSSTSSTSSTTSNGGAGGTAASGTGGAGGSGGVTTSGTGGAGGTGGASGPGGAGGSGTTTGAGGTGGGDPCGYGESLCGGQCIATSSDPKNCGACGATCPGGQVCVSNGCTSDCPEILTKCGGACVDTDSDKNHCGGCGNVCPGGQGCSGGSCVDAVDVGPAPAKCEDGGPPIVVALPDGSEECSGKIADSLGYAICACDDIGLPALGSSVLVDAFDSNAGPYVPFGLGGSVGANDEIRMGSQSDVYGDVRTSANAGWTVLGKTGVHQAARVAESLTLDNPLIVGMDAYIGGPIEASNPGSVGGTLHTPNCGAVPDGFQAGACVSGPVSVPPPCACEAKDLYPVSEIIAHYGKPANNDNALIGLSPDVFTSPGGPSVLELPCGYYYFDRLTPEGPLTISVNGHTAIFVGGSISGSPITFALSPTSTLDVFVGGTVYSGDLKVGSPAYPAKSRFYVAGVSKNAGASCEVDADCWSTSCSGGKCASGETTPKPFSVLLSSKSDLNGGFYAPWGAFVTSSALEMFGALLVKDFHSSSAVAVHYDRAFIKEGLDCPDQGGGTSSSTSTGSGGGSPGCDSCSDCGHQACLGGQCAPCTDSSQCCQPLYCNVQTGECSPLPS